MNIAILGFGLEGQAAYDYWHAGNDITICDLDTELIVPAGAQSQLGAEYLQDLERFDLIVRSPQIHPKLLTTVTNKTTSNLNEFMRVCPTRNIIGVTGTKGKGTTSSLIAKLLQAAGKTVHLGGNIGIAPLELLRNNIQPTDYVVLELSNFQLIDCRYSPHIGVCVMVASEHMDWHSDMSEYVTAKQQLFRWQSAQDTAVYYPENEYSTQIANISAGTLLPYMRQPGAYVEHTIIKIDGQSICDINELELLGAHNWQNVCAALTAIWQVTQDVAALHTALVSFTGLPYRLEFVRDYNGVSFYNDSFGTTPETAIVALQAFTEPKVIILGGSDKGADYVELARTVATSNVRMVVLIGQQAERLQAALDTVGYSNYIAGGTTMTTIVETAVQAAQPGDVVLLSTACASFDMFHDYKDRGAQFRSAVELLN